MFTVKQERDLINYPERDEGPAGFLHASRDDIVFVTLAPRVTDEFGFWIYFCCCRPALNCLLYAAKVPTRSNLSIFYTARTKELNRLIYTEYLT